MVCAWPEPPPAMSAEPTAGVRIGVKAFVLITTEMPGDEIRPHRRPQARALRIVIVLTRWHYQPSVRLFKLDFAATSHYQLSRTFACETRTGKESLFPCGATSRFYAYAT